MLLASNMFIFYFLLSPPFLYSTELADCLLDPPPYITLFSERSSVNFLDIKRPSIRAVKWHLVCGQGRGTRGIRPQHFPREIAPALWIILEIDIVRIGKLKSEKKRRKDVKLHLVWGQSKTKVGYLTSTLVSEITHFLLVIMVIGIGRFLK